MIKENITAIDVSSSHHVHMARAIQLAKRGRYTTHPNPRVGCVIVRDGSIVGEGWHQWAGEGHAEVNALQDAGDLAVGADAYVTLEPCSHFGRTPPCADLLVTSGVRRVFVAMVDPNPLVAGQGLQRLRQAGIEVHCGLLEQEAQALNPGFISAMQRKRPFVRIKMAMSLDGRTAMSSGESVWITGAAARRDVQFWRARVGAIVTGVDTVLMDKPSLNVRLSASDLGNFNSPNLERVRQPLRVILDSQLRCPIDAALFRLEGKVAIYTCSGDVAKITQFEQLGVDVCRFPGEQLDLAAVLSALHDDGINEVHIEAGATLTGRFVELGLADELLVYMAPHLMGSDARALFNLPLLRMQDRVKLKIKDIRAIGDNWRILAGFEQESG